MFTMNRVTVCGFAFVAVLSLAACGSQQSANVATSSSSSPESSVAVGTAPAPTNLEITSWGPDSTKAGVAFNKQPNGSAALWIRVNQSLSGDEAAISFNGTLLQGITAGNLVTAAVPADLYAKPGTYQVLVIAHSGTHTAQSNGVTFTVQ